MIPYLMMGIVDFFGFYNERNKSFILPLITCLLFSVYGFTRFTDIDNLLEQVNETDHSRITAIYEAIEIVPDDARVYTNDKIAAQMSGRKIIHRIDENRIESISKFDYILIDKISPGWMNSQTGNNLISSLAIEEGCNVHSENNAVTLFKCK